MCITLDPYPACPFPYVHVHVHVQEQQEAKRCMYPADGESVPWAGPGAGTGGSLRSSPIRSVWGVRRWLNAILGAMEVACPCKGT